MGPAVIYALSLSEVGHHSGEFHQSVNGIRTARMSLEVNGYSPTQAVPQIPQQRPGMTQTSCPAAAQVGHRTPGILLLTITVEGIFRKER